MSSQKGNSCRSRPQKYQNRTAFKNDLHDKSHKTKSINNMEVADVCEKCKNIIEWKVKYKKYKPLKAPGKCLKCEQKCVKHAYHKICTPCAERLELCAKCGEKTEVHKGKPSKEESIKMDVELQALLKELPERKRRTFIRYMNRNAVKKKTKQQNDKDLKEDIDEETDEEKDDESIAENISKEDLLLKLKSLVINERKDDLIDFDSDTDDDDLDSLI